MIFPFQRSNCAAKPAPVSRLVWFGAFALNAFVMTAFSSPLMAQAERSASLISNGNFEARAAADLWPDQWGRLKEATYETENGNHFFRLKSLEPGKLIMSYRSIAIPAGVKALNLTWRQRISDLKVGKEAWYDARIIMNFKDAAGKQVDPGPPPAASRNDTKGWETRSEQFLVPAGAVTLEFMPSLFQVEQGTFDLDDIALQPIDPTPLLAALRAGQEEDKRNFVAVEAPQPAKWPQPLHIAGRQVLNKAGRTVWLQGVNVPGLEFSRQGDHLLKSVQVSVHDWKANIIRLPVESSYWFGKDAKDGGTAYRALVDAAINIAANRGAYVLLDLHHYGAAKIADVAFWTSAAARYKNHPAVSFDLLNEPHDTSWEVWRNGGFVQDKGASADEIALLSPAEKALNTKGYHAIGMQKLLNAVRATGAKNVVVAGGLDWAYDLSGIANGFALEDKTGNGIIYATHIYNWKEDWKNKVLVVADKHPILLGEVGADVKKMDWLPLDAQEDPSTWVPDMLGFIQKYKLNWTAWSFHPGTTPVLISDWNFTPTPFWGVFAKRALAGEQFPLRKLR